MNEKKLQFLLQCIIQCLSAHGLQKTCEDTTHWAGTKAQQDTLENLHEALLEYLPPLPD